MTEIENVVKRHDYHYTNDPTAITKFLKTMLWISLGVIVLSLLSDLMQMNLLSAGHFSQAQAESNDTRQKIIGVLYLVAFLITAVAFLKWIYRANSNCHGFGVQGMKFTPGWSIGYYFIPILNFFKPYQAMREIWNVSEHPDDWQNKKGSALLGWWWALWLLSNFVSQIAFRMAIHANSIASLQDSTTLSIISGIVDIPSYLVAISLVSAIFAKQEKLVRNHFYHDVLSDHSASAQYRGESIHE